jgi:hypothetical protein
MKPSPASGVLRRICRAYREAAAAYDQAFVRGDVGQIEEALSRMQETAHTFAQGAEWALRQTSRSERRAR